MAKVILLNGSPHPKGCTWVALHEVQKTLEQEGLETELLQVGGLAARGCVACGYCNEQGRCIVEGDPVNEVAEKLEEAAGLVVGSPVYYGSPNGSLLAFLDRLFYSVPYSLQMKVGASVVSCRRGGNTASFDVLNKYFTISGMPLASSTYWNQIHGCTPEQAIKDLEGLQIMRNLGRNMAFLIRAIEAEKERTGLPEVERKDFTSFMDGKE